MRSCADGKGRNALASPQTRSKATALCVCASCGALLACARNGRLWRGVGRGAGEVRGLALLLAQSVQLVPALQRVQAGLCSKSVRPREPAIARGRNLAPQPRPWRLSRTDPAAAGCAPPRCWPRQRPALCGDCGCRFCRTRSGEKSTRGVRSRRDSEGRREGREALTTRESTAGRAAVLQSRRRETQHRDSALLRQATWSSAALEPRGSPPS